MTHVMTIPRWRWDEGIGERPDVDQMIGLKIELIPGWKVKIIDYEMKDECVAIRFELPQWAEGLFYTLMKFTNPFK